MAKINFINVEENLGQALHHWFVNKLVGGQAASYSHAGSYLGSLTPKPPPQDSVIVALKEWEEEMKENEGQLEANTAPSEPIFLPQAPIEPPPAPHIPPLFILRKRLLWFIRNHVINIYKLLGTTKEEMIGLRKKRPLTPEDEKRIDELLIKAAEVNQRLLKKLGIDSDDALVETEKRRHLTKRFNIRETWLPM